MSLLLLFDLADPGGDQTVTQATHFTNTNAFFGGDVRHSLGGSLLVNANSFYAADIRHSLNGSLFSNTNSFFAAELKHILGGSLFANANIFYGASLTTGITQDTSHTNVSLFYGDDVRLSLDGTLYVNPNAFGGQDQLDHIIHGSLFVNQNIFGTDGHVDWLRQGAWYPKKIKYLRDGREVDLNALPYEPEQEPPEEEFDNVRDITAFLLQREVQSIIDSALAAANESEQERLAHKRGQVFLEQQARDEDDALLAIMLAT